MAQLATQAILQGKEGGIARVPQVAFAHSAPWLGACAQLRRAAHRAAHGGIGPPQAL